MTAVLLIANAGAGTEDERAVREAVAVLEAAGHPVETARTDDAASLEAALAELDRRDVVVAGGDGTLHSVAAALARRGQLADPTVGLIPLGTGNDFARSAGIPLDPRAAAQVFDTGSRVRIDLLADDAGGIVVNAVHLGVGAEAARRATAWKPRLGKHAYAVGGIVAGIKARGVCVRVEADGTVVADGSQAALQVGIGNGRFVGGGTALLPRADPTDARADVVVSFAVSPWRRISYALYLRRGEHQRRDDVATARGSVVRVSGEPFWCNADGELTGPHRSRTWTVLPQAMTMALPHQMAD